MTKKIKYTDGPIGEIKVVRDFLPPAAKLAFRTSKSELAEMARAALAESRSGKTRKMDLSRDF